MRELPGERFRALARDRARSGPGIDTSGFAADYVAAALDTCKGKFTIFSELPAYCGFYFTDEIQLPTRGRAKHFMPENKPRLQALRDAFAPWKTLTPRHRDGAQIDRRVARPESGALVHPTRLAVTGSNAGPSLYHLLEILGRGKCWALDRR